MKKCIKNWYYIAVFVAGIFALILALGDWNLREKTLYAGLIFIFFHFFEEFGFPGGFPWIGMKIELKITDNNPKSWPLNQVSSMFGNVWFAIFVYLFPLFCFNVRFLTLAAVIFAFAELLMHLVYFNIELRTWYNPGLFTTVFGLLPVSVVYLNHALNQQLYTWLDLALAFIWIILNYWVAFRSPIYKHLGKMSDQYAFTEDEVNRAEKYMKKHN